MTDCDVLGLGMATIDILTMVPHLPGPNEAYAVDSIHIQGGGPVATALVAFNQLGGSSAYLGTVAPDHWGEMILNEFRQYGVSIEKVKRTATGSSPVSVILIEKDNGRRAILYRKSSLPELTPQDVSPTQIKGARILHLDGVHLPAAIHAAKIANEFTIPVSLDGGAGETWSGMNELLPLVNILVVARQFAARITGIGEPASAGPEMLKFGAAEVVITDGENGCWFFDRAVSLHQPAFHVQVVDTTGAGDTFHGAYLYAFLRGWEPARRLVFASAVAAIKCTQVGGRSGIPNLHEAETFIHQHHGSFL